MPRLCMSLPPRAATAQRLPRPFLVVCSIPTYSSSQIVMQDEDDIGLAFASKRTSTTSLALTRTSTPISEAGSTSNLSIRTMNDATPRKQRHLSLPRSPSSPDVTTISLPMAVTPVRTVSRSKTLHANAGRSLQASTSTNTSIPTLEGVVFEENKLQALRKWILGIAVGSYDAERCSSPP